MFSERRLVWLHREEREPLAIHTVVRETGNPRKPHRVDWCMADSAADMRALTIDQYRTEEIDFFRQYVAYAIKDGRIPEQEADGRLRTNEIMCGNTEAHKQFDGNSNEFWHVEARHQKMIYTFLCLLKEIVVSGETMWLPPIITLDSIITFLDALDEFEPQDSPGHLRYLRHTASLGETVALGYALVGEKDRARQTCDTGLAELAGNENIRQFLREKVSQMLAG